MNVVNMVKLLHVTVIFTGMKEVTLERNSMDITNAVQPLHTKAVIFRGMKEVILDRNTMDVVSVVETYHVTVTFK